MEKVENICSINSSLEEMSENSTSATRMNFKKEISESDVQFKTSLSEDSFAEMFTSVNKTEKKEDVNNSDACEIDFNRDSTSGTSILEKENEINDFLCPLCWKTYEERELFLGHIKICGNKHNKTAKWLLEALKLQERQKAERVALGLPDLLNVQPNKRKVSVKKGTAIKGDANLQLALALSASMKDAEDIERLEEEQHLFELGLGGEIIQEQKNILEKFCFTKSHPVLVPCNSRARFVNRSGNHVLLRRTDVDRERMLSEKVTKLLAENEKVLTEISDYRDYKEEITVSEYIQKYYRKDNKLWHKACSCSDKFQQCSYYVHTLSDFISPCTYAAGSKLKCFPQHSRKNEASESKCPAKHANVQDYQDVTSPLKKTSPFSSSATRNCNTLEKILIKDWKSILNKKTLSDITIYIDKGLKIPAHKLVFYVRCPLVLKDIIKEETGENELSEMLMWLEVSHAAALAFLEYIYCSSTNKIFILKKPDLASVRKLAQRYNVRNLLPYLKMAKDLRTKSSRLSQINEKSLEEGGYLKLKIKNEIKMHECSNSSEIADSLPSDTSNISTVFENENTCNNSGIRESPDLFRDDNENALTDTCHKDSSSQESSKAYIDFLVSLLDELPPTEDHSVKFNELKFCSPEISPKLLEAINNSPFKSSKNVQNYICPDASVQNGYKEQGELKKNIGNRRKNKSSYSENQFSFSFQKTNATEHQMSANNLVKSYKKCLQKNCSPFRHSSIALPTLSNSDIESKNDQPAEIASKKLCSLEENSLKYNIEKMLLECTEIESLEKKSSEGVTESEAMDNSSRRAPEVWSNTSSDGSCLEYKRKHSESDSSLNDTFKKMKSQQTNSEQCNELKVDAMKTSTSKQTIACSDMKEQLHHPVKENAVAGEQSMSNITNVTSPDKVKKLYSAKSDRVLENTKGVKNADGYNCDKEWDSFDEMCHASPTGVFSQPLMSHLANRTPLKKTEKMFKKRSLCSSQPTAVARNSFLDSLNESLFWRDENAPEANCKTPVSKSKAEYVTPPVDYNIMRTTEIKRELRKYGLKPSLTKKQARTMLQYIYDQLHPWVSNAEETSTLLSPQEKFKLLSYSSQTKQNCNAETMSKHPIRRSLLEPSQEQGEADLESEEELMLSQNSFSSTSSAQSDIIRVEEAHSDDQEENCITQEVLSSQDLHKIVHKFIVSKEDFHQKILMGEPFVINELHAALRNIGFKCKMDQLMNYLDEQCITFQTVQQRGRRRRKSSKKNINKTKYLKMKKKKGNPSSAR